MKIGRRTFYNDALEIPKARAGKWRIEHMEKPADHCLPLVNGRTALIGGQGGGQIVNIKFDAPTRWHELTEGKQRWMSDLPIEQRQHDEMLSDVRGGTVLVGGLGLGYAAVILSIRPRVSRVVVVEKSREVIRLVEKATRARIDAVAEERDASAKLEIVHADLFEFLKDHAAIARSGQKPTGRWKPYSWAFYDIWTSDGEGTFFDTVVPLLDLSQGVVKRRPLCWNEDVMRGQLIHSLGGRIRFMAHPEVVGSIEEWTQPRDPREGGAVYHNWRVPFFRWVREKNPPEEAMLRAAAMYARIFGSWEWEKLWQGYIERARWAA